MALTVSPITDDISRTWYVLYTECYLKPQGSLKRERKITQGFTVWDSWVSSRATASCPSRLSAATSFFKGELLLSLEGWGFPGSKLKIWTDQELTYFKEWLDEGIRNTLKRTIIHEVAIHITIFFKKIFKNTFSIIFLSNKLFILRDRGVLSGLGFVEWMCSYGRCELTVLGVP